jgi:ATP-binding cassette subfamily G (WHITE) protein 2 (SNQ2)
LLSSFRYLDGEIIYNTEEDEHAPVLTVGQTLESLLALKRPHNIKIKHFSRNFTGRILDAFGMSHVRNTLVGNSYVRGVSGGERKRVSLSEGLATNPAIACWKGAIRGLDSSVALHYFKVMKELSRSTGMVNIISTYQTSQQAYDLMDRVVVIYSGHQIYSGRADQAEQYFVDMGYDKNPRQTVPDFLTSVTSVTERRVRPGFEGKIPQTAEEFASYFRKSDHFLRLQEEIKLYKARHTNADNGDAFKMSVKTSKHPGTGHATAFRVNFAQQILVLCRRQLQLLNADRWTFGARLGSNILQATLVGAIAYKPPDNANGSYAIAGALFFVILYYTIFALGEIPATINSRPLLVKHRGMGYYHPAAHTIAQILTDIPVYVFQTLVFSAIFYFLVGLQSPAQYFFTFFFIIFTLYMSVSAMYRMISSWTPNLSVALRYGCMALSVVFTTAGFVLASPNQLGWISWLRRASPAAWAFEALMANEFRGRTLRCAPEDLVPNGPGYGDLKYQICTIAGAVPQSDVSSILRTSHSAQSTLMLLYSQTVSGTAYMEAVYGFETSHVWRNIGILWAFFAIYVLMIFIGSSLTVRETSGSVRKIFKRGAVASATPQSVSTTARHEGSFEKVRPDLENLPVFTFKDVRYTVQVAGQDKPLLVCCPQARNEKPRFDIIDLMRHRTGSLA